MSVDEEGDKICIFGFGSYTARALAGMYVSVSDSLRIAFVTFHTLSRVHKVWAFHTAE
jgi:uncharacterized protein (DUF2235 family)